MTAFNMRKPMIAMKKYVNFQLVIIVLALAGLGVSTAQTVEAKPSLAREAESNTAKPIISPEGEWQVEDKNAHIRIASCDGAFWGVISWEKNPGVDEYNPDTRKKKLPILALPILRDMKAKDDGGWHGKIYNADNGKIYTGSIRLMNKDTLKITGCLFDDYLCGGERWQRVKENFSSQVSAMDNKTLCATVKKRMQ